MSRRTSTPLIVGIALLCVLPYQRTRAADDFRLTIGNPIAAMMPTTGSSAPLQKKQLMGNFVVRVDGCPEPAKAEIKATAEGLVNGARRSMPLTLAATPTPGVLAVYRNWTDGVWVVNLVGSYQNLKAGAVVPVQGDTFIRESSKFYPRPATPEEVDAVLKAHAARGGTR